MSRAPIRTISGVFPGRPVLALLLSVCPLLALALDDSELDRALATTHWSTARHIKMDVSMQAGYKPHHLVLRKGQPYVLTFLNSDASGHDFTSSGFLGAIAMKELRTRTNVVERQRLTQIRLKPRQFAELTFVPLVTGEFAFFCSIVGHQEAGMEGVVKIED